MESLFDPFEVGDTPWINPNAPQRVRQADDDDFHMDHEPTPEPESQPDLIQSVEHSFSSVSSSAESNSQPLPGSDQPVPSLFAGSSTIKEEELSDDPFTASFPIQPNPKRIMRGQRQSVAVTPSGLQSPTPSTTISSNGLHQPCHNSATQFNGLQSPTPSITINDISTNGVINNQPPRVSAGDSLLTSQQATLTIDGEEDDDDDFVIITANRASPEAQRKWSQYQPAYSGSHDNAVFIKPEPKDNDRVPAAPAQKPAKRQMDFNKVMAAQRMLLKNMQPSAHGSRTNSIFGSRSGTPTNPYQNQAESSRSGAAHEFVVESPKIKMNTFIRDDPVQVDEAMRDGDEDHSWMHDDSASDDEYETLKTLHTSLAKKEKTGKITPDERMELFKLERTLQMKERLRAAAMQRDAEAENEPEDDSLFVQESREDVVNRHRRDRPPRNSNSSEDDEMPDGPEDGNEGGDDDTMMKMLQQELNGDGLDGPGLTKSGKSRKKRAKNAKEVIEREEENRRQKERSKAQKKGRGDDAATARRKPCPAAKGKGKGKEKASSKKAKGKKGTVTNGESLLRSGNFSRFSGTDDVGNMILENLMTKDPISDRLENPIFNVEPEAAMPGQHRKESQFQMLFANIPTGDGSKANKKSIKNDKKALKEASRSFGYAKVKAQDGKWMIKGMNSTLYHHQLLGAQWMLKRELSSQPPHGGLLADSMGLGKTVQTLACMVGNPPGPEDIKRKVKATLIVVPATVIDQWLDEIRVHAKRETFPKIMRYAKVAHIPIEVLEDLDIVVASYQEVMKQFPFPDKEDRDRIARIGYKNWWKDAEQNLGPLHQVNWYRVVLDEAQNIKNNTARTSLACQNLKSVYRWCLTGTPLLNRLEELFPYLRFLKAHYSMDWQTFQKYFCDPNAPDSIYRIQTVLSYTMMRRTMSTTILNRPIITLPPPHPEIQYIHFSPEEQVIYRITENRFRANLNAYFRSNEARRNYSLFMVQLLRLRQCTSHPFMLERTIKESWTLEDVTELQSRLSRMTHETNKPLYQQCKVWVGDAEARRKARAEAKERGEEVPELGEGDGEDIEELPFGQGDFGYRFNMDKAIKTLSEKELYNRVVCSKCADFPENAHKTDCGHIFCYDCIMSYIHDHTAKSGNVEEFLSCPECDRLFETVVPVEAPSNDPRSSSPSRSRTDTPGKNKKYKETHRNSKGKDASGFEPHTPFSHWLEMSDNDPESFPLTASAKTTALKAILVKGFTGAPFDKVVIYVQFRQLARIVGRICNSESWPFLYLTGDRNLDDRSKVIARFRDDKNVKILIAGLKCGGLGLNFPWANRCISLDLWWNHAVEQQAFGRIFRIGQKKDTYMTRIVVKNTVDMRLLSMQVHKLTNLEKAIKEDDEEGGAGRRGKALGLRELANLFGFLRTDSDGEILSVEADYDDISEDLGHSGKGSSSNL